MKKNISVLVILVFAYFTAFSQSVSVTPSRLYFKEAPGGYKGQKIRVTNNGTKSETFQVTFKNFASGGNKGKTQMVDDPNYEHGCANWLTASPAFFELAPGVTQDVEIIMQVPNLPEANNSRWAVTNVKITKENVGNGEQGSNVTGMQILQTFQFLIHIFQTPPAATFKEAQIANFKKVGVNPEGATVLSMDVSNTGETILDCAPYLDLVNLGTGKSERIKNKAFTILPGGVRQINFYLPKETPKGKYSVLGVIDYGSDTDLAGAELNLEL